MTSRRTNKGTIIALTILWFHLMMEGVRIILGTFPPRWVYTANIVIAALALTVEAIYNRGPR